jgi:hypothetical protein
MNYLGLFHKSHKDLELLLSTKVLKIIEYCQKNYRFMTGNPSLFFMRKLARFEIVRDSINLFRQITTDKKSKNLKQDNSIFSSIGIDDLENIVASIKRDGYYLGLNLPSAIVQEIIDYTYQQPCYGNRNPEYKEYHPHSIDKKQIALQSKYQVCSYMRSPCSAVERLKSDPTLVNIATKFLGARPKIVFSELLWSYPYTSTLSQKIKTAQVFHYDIDDYQCIKFFFYLTNVDEYSGPHIAIKGTHRNKRFIHQFLGQRCSSIPDEEIINQYGTENVTTICGEAGFGFVEDSFCFHKGSTPVNRERLLLQIEFILNSYGDIRGY